MTSIIDVLPIEILYYISEFLDPCSWLQLRRTCTYLNNSLSDQEIAKFIHAARTRETLPIILATEYGKLHLIDSFKDNLQLVPMKPRSEFQRSDITDEMAHIAAERDDVDILIWLDNRKYAFTRKIIYSACICDSIKVLDYLFNHFNGRAVNKFTYDLFAEMIQRDSPHLGKWLVINVHKRDMLMMCIRFDCLETFKGMYPLIGNISTQSIFDSAVKKNAFNIFEYLIA